MKPIKMQWSKLTSIQRNQVIAYYNTELKAKELFIHDLNNKSYYINSYTGNLSM